MLLVYTCNSCGAKRYFTSIQKEEVSCKECNVGKLSMNKSTVTSEIETTPESRFLGDEALFNTIGRRVAAKKSRHYAGK